MLRRWQAGALAVAVASAAAPGCSDGEATPGGFESEPVVVEIQEIRPELLRDVRAMTGQLEAEFTVQVRPDTAGVLESIEFAEGQAVEQGDVLFQLRADEEAARLQEAIAERDLKRATFERTRKLAKRNISSDAQLDRARAELARENARVEGARAELEKTTIRAPFDGMMGALYVAPGARIEPENVLTQIDAIDRLQVVLSLPEIAVGVARVGIPFEFTVAPYPGEVFQGEVYFVAPTVDTRTRRVLVKGWAPNPDHRLRPGLFLSISAEIGRKPDALTVPESALALDREGTFVWRVGDDETVERVGVETGLRSEGAVEILRGLEPGDRVVTAGTNKVRRGSAVRAAGGRESRLAHPEAGAPGSAAGLPEVSGEGS